MKNKQSGFKLTAAAAALLVAGTSIIPVNTAYAHDRQRAHTHGHGAKFHRKAHRKAHRHHRAHVRHNKRRNRDGDLIAAGIIGLAVGAIIASEASKNRQPAYTPQYTSPYPSGSGYYEYDGYGSGQRVPLTDYNSGGYNGNYSSGGPEVITFNEPGSLEPWTPGWREWCENNYRSFNPSTGTFRGYDGYDHFCVPR